MVFHINTFFLPSLMIILNVHLFTTASTTPLEDICNQVSDRSFCLKNIGINPRTWTQGLPLLAHTTIVKAKIAGTTTNNTIHSLRVITVDIRLKTILAQCENSYSDALHAIKIASDDLNNENYRDLRLHAKLAINAVVRCKSTFKSPFESLVTVENLNFKSLCEILEIIAGDLSAGKEGKVGE